MEKLSGIILIISFILISNFSFSNDFTENKGQIADENGISHPEVLYKAKHNNATLFFKKDAVVFVFNKFEKQPNAESLQARSIGDRVRADVLETVPMAFRMDLEFVNSNPDVQIIGDEANKDISNYYLAHCPQGITDVHSFKKITYVDIYPNIDLVYYFNESGLKYDFIIHPGGNIDDIRLKYNGANEVALTQGKLNIYYADGQILTEEQPFSYFEADNIEQDIHFLVDNSTGIIGFTSESNVFQQTLIIDPAINWATYFYNASSSETTSNNYTSPEFDASGNLFFAAQSYDNAFPTANPGGTAWYDASSSTMIKVVVMKMNTSRELVWSTYYGGDQTCCLAGCTDYGKALAVDNNGNVYLAGYTNSGTSTFPTYDPGGSAWYQDDSKIYGETSFAVKFNNDGTRLWASMFQHENANTNSAGMRLNTITCDGTRMYFGGQTYRWNSNDPPLRNPGGGAYYESTYIGSQDAFVGRFNASMGLEWCTYVNSGNVANTAYASALDMTCDDAGNFYMTGRETSNSSTAAHHLITNPGGGAYMQTTPNGTQNIQITKFDASLNDVWSTYYGGNDMDIPSTIEPDGMGSIYIVGRCTESTTFPTYDPGGGAYCQTTKPTAGGTQDGFLLKFTTAGVREWATYLGGAGAGTNHFSGVGFDADGHVYVSGYTNSPSMTTLSQTGSYNQASLAGDYDMFYYEFDENSVMEWATYYGSSSRETAYNGRLGYQEAPCGLMLISRFGTQSTSLTTTDPGGGAWYQSSGVASNNDFLIEFGSNSTPLPVSVSVGASSTTICPGDNVTFTATPTNGGSSPSYQWYLNGSPVGSDNATYSNTSLNDGDDVYCVLTSSEGCVTDNPATSSTTTISVNTNSTAPTSITASSTSICASENVTLDAVGGSLGTGADWEWYSGSCGGTHVGSGASIVVSPTSTTTYYLQAEGDCNSTSCVSVEITVESNSVAASSISADVNPICEGSSVDLSVSGGTLGDGADWVWYTDGCGTGSVIGTGSSITETPSATQTYYVRAEGNCNTTSCVQLEVVVNTPPDAGADGSVSICENGSSITLFDYLAGNPETGGYWIDGSGSSVSETFDPNTQPAGVYTYVIDGVSPCPNDSAEVTVNFNLIPQIDSIHITDISVCAPPYDGSITIYVNGSASDYDYSIDGGPTQTDSTFSYLNAGAYTMGIMSPEGCYMDTLITIGSSSGLTIDSVLITDVSCYGGNDGEISIYSENGYLYSIDDGGSFQTGITFEDLSVDTLDIVVQDVSGCEFSSQVIITQPDMILLDSTVTNSNCGPNGSAEIIASGGVSPYTYLWNTGGTSNTLVDITAGTYTVTVTDANLCNVSTSIIVGEDGDLLEFSGAVTDLNCYGQNIGAISVTMTSGTAPFSYNWSNGADSASISELGGGTYYLTITDDNGCTAIDSFLVDEPGALDNDLAVENVSCYEGNDGAITLSMTGGTPDYTMTWAPSGFMQNDSMYYNLEVATYSVTIVDDNGCELIIPKIDVLEPTPINLGINVNDPICYGDYGSVTTQITGGTPTYTVSWSNGGTTPSQNDLDPGTYTLNVTDDNGCLADTSITVVEPEQIEITAVVEAPNIDITVTGGTIPYYYLWSNDEITEDVSTVISGDYTVTVTDNNGCTNSETFELIMDLEIPDAFSPNGDGSNDYWEIVGIEQYSGAEIEIYNRWGQLIFESVGYDDMWDGTYNGNDVPHGSYVFILKLGEGFDPVNGIVTVIR
jgi:gliding motility-associated-like protein